MRVTLESAAECWRCGDELRLIDVALLTGRALTDLARTDEAETTSAALAAAVPRRCGPKCSRLDRACARDVLASSIRRGRARVSLRHRKPIDQGGGRRLAERSIARHRHGRGNT
jgi:hypothetical protein